MLFQMEERGSGPTLGEARGKACVCLQWSGEFSLVWLAQSRRQMHLPPTAQAANMCVQGWCNYERIQRELWIQKEIFIGWSVPRQRAFTQPPAVVWGLSREGNIRRALVPRDREMYTDLPWGWRCHLWGLCVPIFKSWSGCLVQEHRAACLLAV